MILFTQILLTTWNFARMPRKDSGGTIKSGSLNGFQIIEGRPFYQIRRPTAFWPCTEDLVSSSKSLERPE
jgi:hypothetical protein